MRGLNAQHAFGLGGLGLGGAEEDVEHGTEEWDVHAIGRCFSEGRSRGRGHRHRSARSHRAASEMFAIGVARLLEQCPADRLDAHPFFRILPHRITILLQPASSSGGDLRSGRGRPGSIEADQRLAIVARPGAVRRVGGHGGVHLAVRSIGTAHHARVAEIGVGRSVRHHATGGHHALEASRIDDEARHADLEETEVVAGRGHHRDARFVGLVDHIHPELRGDSAHAHGDDVHALFDGIGKAFGHGTVGEQHHRIRHAHGDDGGEWGSADDAAWHLEAGTVEEFACQDAERARAVAGIVAEALGVRVGGVVGVGIFVDKVALADEIEELGEHGVAFAVAGVEMGDGDAVGGLDDLRAG